MRRFWIKTFPVQFELDAALTKAMDDFRDVVKTDALNENFVSLVDISNKLAHPIFKIET